MTKILSNVKKPGFQAHTHWCDESATGFLFLRHAETSCNTKRIIQGWKNTSLNKMGLAQAAVAAARIQSMDMEFSAVISSDIRRSLQTAKPVARQLKCPLIEHQGLRERHFGAWEGKTIDEVLVNLKLGPQARRDPFLSFEPDGGETMKVFSARIKASLDALEKQYKGKNIVVVTHGGPVRIASCMALKIPVKKYFLLGRPANTSLTLMQSQGGVRWVEFYNDASHLESEGLVPKKSARTLRRL